MRRTTLAAPALLLAASAIVLAACGGEDQTATSAPSATDEGVLRIVGEDVDFDRDSYEADAGTIDIVYENGGVMVHTLVIEGVDDFKLTVSSRGDVDEGSVELDAGTYDLFCDVPGHLQAGMEATLVVR